MRAKKTKSVALAAIDKAWSEAFADKNVEDAELLRKQGWKSVYDLSAETGRLANTLSTSMRVAVESDKFLPSDYKVVKARKSALALVAKARKAFSQYLFSHFAKNCLCIFCRC